MAKTQEYLREEELKALCEAAARSGRSVADLVREAIRRTWLCPDQPDAPVALWNGEPTATSVDHDRHRSSLTSLAPVVFPGRAMIEGLERPEWPKSK